jgi:hypothetical protein
MNIQGNYDTKVSILKMWWREWGSTYFAELGMES